MSFWSWLWNRSVSEADSDVPIAEFTDPVEAAECLGREISGLSRCEAALACGDAKHVLSKLEECLWEDYTSR